MRQILLGHTISLCLYRDKCKQKVCFHEVIISGNTLMKLYISQIKFVVLCLLKSLIKYSCQFIAFFKSFRIISQFLQILDCRIIRRSVICTHYPVGQCRHCLSHLVIYKSQEITCFHIRLIISERHLKSIHSTGKVMNSGSVETYVVIVQRCVACFFQKAFVESA